MSEKGYRVVKEMRATPPVLPKALRPGRRLSSPVTRLLSIGPPPEVLHVVLRGSGRTGGRCSRDTSNGVSPRGSVRIWSTPRRVTSTMCQKGDSTAFSLSLPPCSWIALWFFGKEQGLPGAAAIALNLPQSPATVLGRTRIRLSSVLETPEAPS